MVDVWAFCNTVTAKKALVIKNPRFGVFFRLLQIGFLVLVLLNIFVSQGWFNHTTPVKRGIEMWGVEGPSALMTNTNVTHCSNASAFWYSYSTSLKYQPAKCTYMSAGEGFLKQGLDIYVPTYIWDRYTTESSVNSGSASPTPTPTPSPSPSPSPSPTSSSSTCPSCPSPGVQTISNGQCFCSETVMYLAENPEQRLLYLNHGFSVDQVNIWGLMEKHPLEGKSSVEAGDMNILTVFTMDSDPDKPCSVGGKSSWSRQDAAGGINGPLEDWLRCGGISLEDHNPSSASGAPGADSFPPKVRITGAKMSIQLNYRNNDKHGYDHPGPICFVGISVLPEWNSRTSMEFQQLPHSVAMKSIYRYRYMFGVSIAISVSGDFAWFDFKMLVMVLTSSIVLLKTPQIIIVVLSMNLAGRLSRIYNFVAVQKLSIVHEFPGVCARVIGYASDFDRICGKSKEGSELRSAGNAEKDLGAPSVEEVSAENPKAINAAWSGTSKGISLEELHQRWSECMADQIKSGVLSKEEIDRMVNVLMYQMDPSKTKSIETGEFCKNSSSNEVVKISDVSGCFDVDHQASCLERLIGDIRNEVREEEEGKKVV